MRSVSLSVPRVPAELLSDLLDQAVAPQAPTELLDDLPDQAVAVEGPGQAVLEGEVQDSKSRMIRLSLPKSWKSPLVGASASAF